MSQLYKVTQKGPHRESFSPAYRWLHSTRPDNHSQLGAFIHMQLFTISPYPEQIHTAHSSILYYQCLPTSTHSKTRTQILDDKRKNAAARGLQPKSNKQSTTVIFLIMLKRFFSYFFFSLCTPCVQHFYTSVDCICLSIPGPLWLLHVCKQTLKPQPLHQS